MARLMADPVTFVMVSDMVPSLSFCLGGRQEPYRVTRAGRFARAG
jgi:hypothetical protein